MLTVILTGLMVSMPQVVRAVDSRAHAPILIDGNDGFTADNGVTGGTGTGGNPYVISGWTIQAQDYGIEIANTTAYFTITNVTISCSTVQPNCLDGIILSSIQNGVVQSSHISVQGIGIRVENSVNFQLTRNDVRSGGVDECGGAPACERWGAIFLNMSSSFDASNNRLEGGPGAINGFHLSDASIVGNTGGGEDGITLNHVSGMLIGQNSIQAHTPIAVYSCGDLTVDDNTVTSPDTGITVSNCNNVLVSNNTASNIGGVGIWVTGSDAISITGNTVSRNTDGIRLTNFATGNTITGNQISNNQCGIQTDSSSSVDQNYVADNTFAGNAQDYWSI
jgi:parallel beta-helix repeat protein